MFNRADDTARWDKRIARARQLATQYPTAAELLIFYTALAEYQKSLLSNSAVVLGPFDALRVDASNVERRQAQDERPKTVRGATFAEGFGGPTKRETRSREPVEPRTRSCELTSIPFFEALDLESVLAAIPDFLSWLSRAAPARLSEAAAEMRRLDRAEWRHLAHSYLADDGCDVEEADQTRVFVLEALLQPFAEQLAIRIANSPEAAGAFRIPDPQSPIPKPDTRAPGGCPICGSLPVLGVLREEGHGAKRTLVCARCLTEREYLRVVCPACGEQQFDALPVYTADQFAHVRIEACDGCHRYLKTIDLTKDGLAVPLVDDIASVSLDLWARDQGYTRLRSSLLKM